LPILVPDRGAAAAEGRMAEGAESRCGQNLRGAEPIPCSQQGAESDDPQPPQGSGGQSLLIVPLRFPVDRRLRGI
jgi:hypothetical protein